VANDLTEYVARPFEGLNGETDWVALAQIVPQATATAATKDGTEIKVVTLLPDFRTAWHHPDGTLMLALQTTFNSGDRSRDLAQALGKLLKAAPGKEVAAIDLAAPGPRLQDLLDPTRPFEVTVHHHYDFWPGLEVEGVDDMDELIDQASEAVDPTEAVAGIAGAYWTTQNRRPFLRWSMDVAEESLLDALARLHAARESAVMPGAKYAGAFRALGLMIPVWELPAGTEAGDLPEPAAAFRTRLDEALAADADLTVPQRRARAGLVARSQTIR
jgi:hypothetical protein